MASSSGESTIGYVKLGLERHVTYRCEPFDRDTGLLMSLRAGGSVAADVGRTTKRFSSNMIHNSTLFIARSYFHDSGTAEVKGWN